MSLEFHEQRVGANDDVQKYKDIKSDSQENQTRSSMAKQH